MSLTILLWYVVYSRKLAFVVYLIMLCVHHAWAVYNVVHLFLVLYKEGNISTIIQDISVIVTVLQKIIHNIIRTSVYPSVNENAKIWDPLNCWEF